MESVIVIDESELNDRATLFVRSSEMSLLDSYIILRKDNGVLVELGYEKAIEGRPQYGGSTSHDRGGEEWRVIIVEIAEETYEHASLINNLIADAIGLMESEKAQKIPQHEVLLRNLYIISTGLDGIQGKG